MEALGPFKGTCRVIGLNRGLGFRNLGFRLLGF